MHYELELDLFCRCIRANISIMLHKTIYEINSALLLRTHFKPPSSVCNNFLLRSHVEFGRLLLYNMLFIAFFITVQISISDVGYTFIIVMKISKSQEDHIQTISYSNCVFIIFRDGQHFKYMYLKYVFEIQNIFGKKNKCILYLNTFRKYFLPIKLFIKLLVSCIN